MTPIAQEYQHQIQADLFVVTGQTDRVLASVGAVAPDALVLAGMLPQHLTCKEATWFWPYAGGVLRLAALPLSIAPGPERLGTLIVGFRLDQTTQRIKTQSEYEANHDNE